MTELSHQAQAVLDAAAHRYGIDGDLQDSIAAALRAAALQIENSSDGRGCLDILRQIATELENQ